MFDFLKKKEKCSKVEYSSTESVCKSEIVDFNDADQIAEMNEPNTGNIDLDIIENISKLGTSIIDARLQKHFAEINSRTVIEVEKIRATKDVLKENIAAAYGERKMIFEEHFKKIDLAIERGDSEILNLAFNSITSIAKSNPVAELHKALNDKKIINSGEKIDFF